MAKVPMGIRRWKLGELIFTDQDFEPNTLVACHTDHSSMFMFVEDIKAAGGKPVMGEKPIDVVEDQDDDDAIISDFLQEFSRILRKVRIETLEKVCDLPPNKVKEIVTNHLRFLRREDD